MNRLILSLLLLVSSLSVTNLSAQETKMTTFVSMVQLLSNPEQYNGKKVRVVGYLWIEFEGTALYFHKEDKVNSLTKNAIALNLPEKAIKDGKQLSGHYALIEGVFDSSDTGHMGLYSGTIHSIQRTAPMLSQK